MSFLSKLRPTFPVYLLAAVLALVWRVLAIPWDWGGLFVQFIMTAFGLMVFASKQPPTQSRFQQAVYYSLFTVSCWLWSVQVYYAPQAVGPFIISCFILVLIWGGDKGTKAKVSNTLWAALPLALLLIYGVNRALPAYRLKHLSPEQVRAVELESHAPGERGGSKIELSSQSDVAEFVSALRATTPYSPEHESLASPWRATVVLNSGEKLSFDFGRGPRGRPDTCRLELGMDISYQNQPLCRFLQTRVPRPLWDDWNQN